MECDKESERIIAAFIKNRQYESKAKLVEKCSRNPDKYASSGMPRAAFFVVL